MPARLVLVAALACFVSFLAASSTRADGPGQADIDQATESKIAAESLADLERVIALCESGLAKGVDKDNADFAKQLLASSLLQHATRFTEEIFDENGPHPRWVLFRQLALLDLDKILAIDEKRGDVHLLIARLHALPGGDAHRAKKGADEAVRLIEDPQERAEAHLARATLAEKPEERLADIEAALRLDPNSVAASLRRAVHHLEAENVERALADFQAVLRIDEEHSSALIGAIQCLRRLKKTDEAIAHARKLAEVEDDSPLAQLLLADLHLEKEDLAAALEAINEAIRLAPDGAEAFLMRSRVHAAMGKTAEAKSDADRVLKIVPGLPAAILLRSRLAAVDGRLEDAISDMARLVHEDPRNGPYKRQLAMYYTADSRPRKAIALLDEVLAADPRDAVSLRARGDAHLAVGRHAEAIADFEAALKLGFNEPGFLNNFAWVLATSPDEKLRDGRRAVELATLACEATDYKEAHILSTLAAAHAETGDFETAVKWCRKAVERGKPDNAEQLADELASYLEKKPWRERQDTKEKPDSPRQAARE
jgi:tetratricopeptide (TPR) repeat protein